MTAEIPKKTAQTWFASQDMGDGITRIREMHLDPMVACNIWHIRGNARDLLFDSGTGLVSLKDRFPRLVRHPVICISSHSHFDHIGGSYEFEDRRMHPAEADIITAPNRRNTTVEGYMDWDLFSAIPFRGFDPDLYQVRPARPTRFLKDGDTIDLGNRTLEVMHLPGHSPGTIALYDAATRVLFSGDVIYDGILFDDAYHSDIPVYRASMERLLTLVVSRVFGGHYGDFHGRHMQVLIHAYLDATKGG